jgi:D-beta-D-heptose 7-phosphate kinase/D-beta-D-heptose 1-phosphate adenosyltransferase
MLDRYVWGDVERISPEAPIPILRIRQQEQRLGGAGSVASMLITLGARMRLAAIVGDDDEGRTVRELLANLNIDSDLVVTVTDRCTTVKERLLGCAQHRYPHQMLRVDRESEQPISAETANLLLTGIRQCIGGFDLVLVSDYNKGVCKDKMLPQLVQLARAAGVSVVADPVKDSDYRRYAGCACITPNREEASRALGIRIASPDEGVQAARRLLDFDIESAVVTLDRDGVAWADRSGNYGVFQSRQREVCDITGAGDMVLAVLGYLLAAKVDLASSVEVANAAGGLEVERLGVVPLTREEILAELTRTSTTPPAHKVLLWEDMDTELDRHREAGRRIVMTNGCFDLLHPGHIALLREARRQGDCLLVGLNSDRSVQAIKGKGRPIIDQDGRAEMLAALDCVDYIVIFDDCSVERLVALVRPNVLVKADQYRPDQVVGHQIVLDYGGQVVTLPTKPGYSTSSLIKRIRDHA